VKRNLKSKWGCGGETKIKHLGLTLLRSAEMKALRKHCYSASYSGLR
jgi:hypothetical protein